MWDLMMMLQHYLPGVAFDRPSLARQRAKRLCSGQTFVGAIRLVFGAFTLSAKKPAPTTGEKTHDKIIA